MPRLPLRPRSASALLIIVLAGLFGCADTAVHVFDSKLATPREDPLSAQPLRVGGVLTPTEWDPHARGGWHESTALIHETLFVRDASTGQAQARLARTATVSADGRRWDLTLNSAVWHNGEAVTADDVLRSIDRARSSAASAILQVALQRVDHLSSANPHSVSIHLTRPEPGLAEALCRVAILPRGEPSTVGAGPYRIESRDDAVVDLVRFVGYRGPTPAIDRIEIHLFLSASQRERAIREGRLEVALLTGRELFSPATLARVRRILPADVAFFLRAAPGREGAVEAALDRRLLIDGAVFGRGAAIDGLHPGLGATPSASSGVSPERYFWMPSSPDLGLDLAESLQGAVTAQLKKAGWTRQPANAGAAAGIRIVALPAPRTDLSSRGSLPWFEVELEQGEARKRAAEVRDLAAGGGRLRAMGALSHALKAAGFVPLLRPEWAICAPEEMHLPELGRDTGPLEFAAALRKAVWTAPVDTSAPSAQPGPR